MALVIVGVALGMGLVALRAGEDQPSRAHHGPSVARFTFHDGPLPAVTAPPANSGQAPVPIEEPSSAEAALASYLTLLAREDLTSAYALLDGPSLQRYASTAAWARAQADRAPISAFELGGSRPAFVAGGEVAEIEVWATHRPSLDAVRGLVPARSRSLWQVRMEQGRWRVGAEPLVVSPTLPPDAAADDVVRAWLQRLQACDRPGAAVLQASTYLYGPASLVGEPCARPAGWEVGDTGGLDQAGDQRDFVAAFGPAVATWARAVPIRTPAHRFLVVVAPLGDTWRVMGVAVMK